MSFNDMKRLQTFTSFGGFHSCKALYIAFNFLQFEAYN